MLKRRHPHYPQFCNLVPASTAASSSKAANKSRDTKPERALRRALNDLGLRPRRRVATVPVGRPDFVFCRARVAVFCDGDFWHGRNWRQLHSKLRTGHNPDYWCRKISANRARDVAVNRELARHGWTICRFWESDVLRTPGPIARQIYAVVRGSLPDVTAVAQNL